MVENLNLIFNKLYYEEIGTDGFDKSLANHNRTILNAVFSNEKDYTKSLVSSHNLILKTTYPGLLIGTGNPHGAHKSDEDINMGFSFDYVSGQPFIPGSSVKGMLRSCFKNFSEVVVELLGNPEVDVKKLETEIFEDGKDLFFDAVLYDGNEYGLVIGEDYITPHKDATKNPVPIKTIKVLPDVRFEFRFVLNDGVITAGKKRFLFGELLKLFGVGAKTNVGYGAFAADDLNGKINPKKERKITDKTDERRDFTPRADNRQNQKNGEVSDCTVTGTNDKYGVFVKLDGSGESALVHISKIPADKKDNLAKHYPNGTKCKVRTSIRNDGKISGEFC